MRIVALRSRLQWVAGSWFAPIRFQWVLATQTHYQNWSCQTTLQTQSMDRPNPTQTQTPWQSYRSTENLCRVIFYFYFIFVILPFYMKVKKQLKRKCQWIAAASGSWKRTQTDTSCPRSSLWRMIVDDLLMQANRLFELAFSVAYYFYLFFFFSWPFACCLLTRSSVWFRTRT